MADILIRTLKRFPQYPYGAYPTPIVRTFPETSTDFAFYWQNEYLLELDEFNTAEIVYIVNCLCMAERQLLVSSYPYAVTVANILPGGEPNGSPALMLFAKKNEAWKDRLAPIVPVKIPIIRFYPTEYTEEWVTRTIYEIDRPLPQSFTISTANVMVKPPLERALVMCRNCNVGDPRNQAYYGALATGDTEIAKDGTIILVSDSELMKARIPAFNYYMRFVNTYMNTKHLKENQRLEEKSFSFGPWIPKCASDMKAQKRKHDKKSIAAVLSYGELSVFISEYHEVIKLLSYDAEQWGLNLFFRRPGTQSLEKMVSLLKKILQWMYGHFPYMKNGLEIDREIYGSVVLKGSNYLIPNFNYTHLHTNFIITEGFYYALKSYLKKINSFAWNVGSDNAQYHQAGISYIGSVRTIIDYSKPVDYNYHSVPEVYLADVNTLLPLLSTFKKVILNYQNILVWLERLWDVRSYSSAYNRKIKKRVFYNTVKGKRVSTRADFESGIRYPRASTHYAKNAPEKIVRGQTSAAPNAAYYAAGLADWWIWGSYEYNEPDVLLCDPEYYRKRRPPAPEPGDVGHENRKPFKWDNTIHPLDAEDEDREAIAMLEQAEEGARKTAKGVWALTVRVLEARKIHVPKVIEGAVDIAIDVVADEINPTDRVQIKAPGIHITFTDDGSIPTTYDGPKYEILP